MNVGDVANKHTRRLVRFLALSASFNDVPNVNMERGRSKVQIGPIAQNGKKRRRNLLLILALSVADQAFPTLSSSAFAIRLTSHLRIEGQGWICVVL